jgi:nitrate/TMAO reductase-like tetraheme cytochrome c subunit
MLQAIREWWYLVTQHKRAVTVLLGLFIMAALLVFVVGVTTWEYTNSTAFCGTTCHTMPPEFVAYEQSPHARVLCVDCHLGPESALNAIPRKAQEFSHVTSMLLADYHTPIYVKNLRPARETCEQCHFPEKFSFDTLQVITHYALDEANTPRDTYLVLKTGGEVRPGLSRGIHWHIASQVWYLATDALKQEIVYVREILEDGTTREYFDIEAGLDANYVAGHEDELRRMDCIDCHNRVSHTFPSPEQAMDQALSTGQIDPGIPFIKSWGVDILQAQFASHEEANEQIEQLDDWLQRNYPELANTQQDRIAQAIDRLKRIYQDTVFPEMDIGWVTHPDNIGHKEFPGCFRCHDGKHISPQGEAIRLECNVCHTIPEVTGPGLPAPVIGVAQANEPESHRSTNWLFIHREEQVAQDAECAGCHNTADAGQGTNVSFCSNSACHGTEWVYAGLDAPGLRQAIAEWELLPEPTPGPPSQETEAEVERPVSVAALEKGRGPDIPHQLSEQRRECLRCHTVDGLIPTPKDHAEYAQEECSECHRPARVTLRETGE